MAKAGRKRVRISVERVEERPLDAEGSPVEVWTEYVSRRAEVRPGPGREIFRAQTDLDQVDVRFVLRYDGQVSGITAKDRVIHDGQTFDILSAIDPDDRSRQFVLFAQAQR